MIDAILFRCRVGLYQHRHPKINSNKMSKYGLKPQVMYNMCGLNILPQYVILYYIFILYIYMFILATVQQVAVSDVTHNKFILSTFLIPFSASIHIKLQFAVLISYLIRRLLHYRYLLTFKRFLKSFKLSSKKRYSKVLGYLINWIFLLNFLMIAIVNPSLLNPGPNHISVVYHNVQGLIPFCDMGQTHPRLDQNKLSELQAHVYYNKPDIVVLNETWLRSSILDNEIFPESNYKIFRNDRSQWSHLLIL